MTDEQDEADWRSKTDQERIAEMDEHDARLDAMLSPVEREIGSSTILVIHHWNKPPRKLKPAGFWSTGKDSLLPHPDDLRDRAWNPKERRAVIAYLRSGQVHQQWMGSSYCRCGCEEPTPGGADLTDGVWVWPEGLPHYIEEHGVQLPADFVAYIMERS